ncbi:hypothetical protein LINPERHAP2_LOCUS343 [Linum perenne]
MRCRICKYRRILNPIQGSTISSKRVGS